MPSVPSALVAAIVPPTSPPALVEELEAWVAESARVRAFVEANAAKIRRKLREARDPETLRDVRAELAVAARLLADPRITLAYEAYGSGNAGPDFSLDFRTVKRLNLEVTRRRGPGDAAGVVEAIIAKLRQLPPAVPNVLVVALDAPVQAPEVEAAVRTLRARVEARDPSILARVRAERPRDFYERFLRLGAVIAWAEREPPGSRAVAWPNTSARIAPDQAALAAVVARLAG